MSKKIGIIIKDDLGNPIYGAKTYIGNKDGKRLYEWRTNNRKNLERFQ